MEGPPNFTKPVTAKDEKRFSRMMKGSICPRILFSKGNGSYYEAKHILRCRNGCPTSFRNINAKSVFSFGYAHS